MSAPTPAELAVQVAAALERAGVGYFLGGSVGKRVMVKTPEDSVLRKLSWFKDGGEASNQQLRDVVEILRVQADRLDARSLDGWARRLGLEALLARARAEATGAP